MSVTDVLFDVDDLDPFDFGDEPLDDDVAVEVLLDRARMLIDQLESEDDVTEADVIALQTALDRSDHDDVRAVMDGALALDDSRCGTGDKWCDPRRFACTWLYPEAFRDLTAAAEFFDVSERQVARWIEKGVDWNVAEFIAVRLSQLPWMIWPEWCVLPDVAFVDLDRQGDQQAMFDLVEAGVATERRWR